MKNIVVAIDGPVGSGKGTLGSLLAKKINAVYLYTGGMYRALALAVDRENVDLQNEEDVLKVLQNCNLNLQLHEGSSRIFLGQEDVTEKIFAPEVDINTSILAQYPKVREEMVIRQKAAIEGKSAVIEGRDIATKVAPNAQLKIYLTADVKTRAQRRLEQFREKGIEKSFDEVLLETWERDRRDSERQTSPLSVSSDAIVIDTTLDTVSGTVDKVIKILKDKNLYD